jgi:uncharacterized protein YyaL (SSP411 family)
LVDAHIAFGDPEYLDLANKTALFITETQRRDDGGLNHNFKNGTSNINGFLEDYSQSMEALIRLYEASFEEKWLKEAKKMADYSVTHFYDSQSGMFFFTSNLDPELVARKMEVTDNVITSSNSSMANALFLLGSIYNNKAYTQMSEGMLNNVQDQMSSYGSGYSHWGNLMLKNVHPFYEVAIVGVDCIAFGKEFNTKYIPNKLVLGSNHESNLPLLEAKYMDGVTLYYVCFNKACQLPTESVSEALRQIN